VELPFSFQAVQISDYQKYRENQGVPEEFSDKSWH